MGHEYVKVFENLRVNFVRNFKKVWASSLLNKETELKIQKCFKQNSKAMIPIFGFFWDRETRNAWLNGAQ